jgi:hypothetical protein
MSLEPDTITPLESWQCVLRSHIKEAYRLSAEPTLSGDIAPSSVNDILDHIQRANLAAKVIQEMIANLHFNARQWLKPTP